MQNRYSDLEYSSAELASCIIRLFESGLRNSDQLSEFAAHLAHLKYEKQQASTSIRQANSEYNMRAVLFNYMRDAPIG
ncbi:hypothetical protein [Falsochrobactrum shanghaiense]|uniref:hypothetical protein n=1 Tax=Falsochrobactrum shanghaiense TaxID=2201899 RepID=UPI0018EE9C1E|nr:hypothetical protein [Falsochrobactrum shanghaiense]